jgi:hypothetical protein
MRTEGEAIVGAIGDVFLFTSCDQGEILIMASVVYTTYITSRQV